LNRLSMRQPRQTVLTCRHALTLDSGAEDLAALARSRAVSWAVKRGLPHCDAEDVVQDVFAVWHRRQPDFEDSPSALAWVMATMRNLCRNHHRFLRRRGARIVPFDGRSAGEEDGIGEREPEQRFQEREKLNRVMDAFQRLRPELAEAMWLSLDGGLTAAEIALRTGNSPNTVSSRLRQARQQLLRDLHRSSEPAPAPVR
jgi:RNA polymerase sigma factor (sigma-70 family)